VGVARPVTIGAAAVGDVRAPAASVAVRARRVVERVRAIAQDARLTSGPLAFAWLAHGTAAFRTPLPLIVSFQSRAWFLRVPRVVAGHLVGGVVEPTDSGSRVDPALAAASGALAAEGAGLTHRQLSVVNFA
jgi:hypothetical protein